jgi:hypothetical protein
MNPEVVEIEGTLQADGTVVLNEKPHLRPGKVLVTIKPLSEKSPEDEFWAGLHAIWASQAARGHKPREKADIDSQIKEFRDEAEGELRGVEQVHRDAAAKS